MCGTLRAMRACLTGALVLWMALAIGCDDAPEKPVPGEGAPVYRSVRPMPMLAAPENGDPWRPMRVRPQAIAPLAIEASDAHLKIIRTYLASEDVQTRARFAAQLQSEIGAEATARAIPDAVIFPAYRGRLVEGHVYRSEQGELPYLAVLPKDYDPKRSWPMHVDLHGGGGAGIHHRACLKKWGTSPGDFILLCPTSHKGHWWFDEGEETALAVFNDALKHFNVDTDRVSLGGLSNGGNGTWHLGHKYPWLWSALVPRCAGKIRRFDFITNIMGMPIFMIHGAMDPQIPVDLSRQMLEQFRLRRRQLLYVEVEGGGHQYFPELNPRVAPWFLEQKRALPEAFSFVPTPGWDHGTMHWLEMNPPSPLHADLVGSESGTKITVTTRRPVEQLRIYLNAAMADLDKPVTVTVNDRVVWRGVVEQKAGTALRTYRLSRDPKRIFTASLLLSLQ
jgi:poly(3-hydroxybutyrate) depolymerase